MHLEVHTHHVFIGTVVEPRKLRNDMTKIFSIAANGTLIGGFEADTSEDAILAYVRDAGYRDVAHAAEVLGQTEDEFIGDLDIEEAA